MIKTKRAILSKIIQKSMRSVIFLLVILTLAACASTGKSSKSTKKVETKTEVDYLSPEARRKYEYYFLEAIRKKSQGEYTAAFELFEHCLAIDSRSAAVLSEMSQFYQALKQPEQALSAMENAVKQDPDNYWYHQTVASYYQSKGNYKKAIDVMEGMYLRFPDREITLMGLIDLYNQVKDYPNVVKSLNRLETKTGKSEQISMEKFRIYLMMEDDKKAFSEIEALAGEYPNDMRYQSLLGDVYLNNKKPKQAYDTYQRVLSIEPDNAMALVSLASYYQQMGNDSLYNQQLNKVLLNKKVNSTTKLNIMRELIGKSEQSAAKDSTQIIALFDSILKVEQEDAQVPMLYAQYLISKGMDQEAVPVLDLVVELDPENTAARLTLLSFALRKNDFPAMIAICKPALEYSPETLEFYFYLGFAYYQEEQQDEALLTYQKALKQINEKSNKLVIADFYSVMGDIYHNKKQPVEAYAAYDSALVYNPNNTGALNNYAYYLSVDRKELDRAEEMSYRTVKAEPNNATFLDTYAWILFEKEKYAEALIYIENAMKNGGDENDVVLEHCGDIYFMNGNREKALEYWLQAQKMGSKSTTLKKKIEQKKYMAE